MLLYYLQRFITMYCLVN